MSIGTAVRVLIRKAKKTFPGASDGDINTYVTNHLMLVISDPGAKDEDVAALAAAQLDEAASNNEEWAVNLRDSVLLNVVKPIVDKASEKGVDPVPALVLSPVLDVTEEQAQAYVTALEERATAPSIPAQANDENDSSDGDTDSEDETSEFSSAVTVQY